MRGVGRGGYYDAPPISPLSIVQKRNVCLAFLRIHFRKNVKHCKTVFDIFKGWLYTGGVPENRGKELKAVRNEKTLRDRQTGVRMTETLYAQVKEYAERHGLTVSAAMCLLVTKGLEVEQVSR